MKTILYSIIAIFIFGIIATAVPHNETKQSSILLQAVNPVASQTELEHSAQIISNRLKDMNAVKFEVKIIAEKKQVQIVLPGDLNVKTAEILCLQKGSLEFFETLTWKDLPTILNGDTSLCSLLTRRTNNPLDAQLGCVAITQMQRVSEYLKALSTPTQCKFAWSLHAHTPTACLYALKTGSTGHGIMKATDIESVKAHSEASKLNVVFITFKKTASSIWADVLRRNLNHSIAIVMDNTIIAAPIVRSVSENGSCVIAGNYTADEAKVIAALGNNGELPLDFTLVK